MVARSACASGSPSVGVGPGGEFLDIQVQRDGQSAPSVALAAVLPNNTISVNLCSAHAYAIVPKKQSLFKNWGKGPTGEGGNGERFMADLLAIV